MTMTSQSSEKIPFTKASACGNDFLMVESTYAVGNLNSLSRRMCDRHNGIGADGVEWLSPDGEADVKARLINADGSDAEISGNGTRCVAALICSREGKAEVRVATGAGVKLCRLIRQEKFTFEFEADMGRPEVGEQLSIETAGVRTIGTQISIGNPHFVVFVETFDEDWQGHAAQIAAQKHFPQGTNVEYVVWRSASEIEIRLFERGVGETQSSGTGSCAAAVAAIASRRASSPIRVLAPGGAQTVRWDEHVFLQGPATLVCSGELLI
jgi:diaminopimelate epimerase